MHKQVFSTVLLFVATLLAVGLSSPDLQAKKRVVLLPFDADDAKEAGKNIRTFIQDLLKNNYDYVQKKDLKESGEEEIDFRDLNPDTVKKLSKQFSITAWVGAEIKKEKLGKFVFKTKIYSWETGEILEQKEYNYKGKPSQKQIEEMAALVLETIESMKEYTPPEEPKVEVAAPQVEEKVENPEPLDPSKTKIQKVPKAVEPNVVPAVSAGLVFGFLTRSLDFSPATEPYYKTSSPSFAPQLRVAVYPLALGGDAKSVGARLGLNLAAMFMPAFKSYPADDKDNEVGTTVLDINAAVTFRQPIGQNVHVIPRVGYAMRQWTFAKKDALDVPGVSYSSVDLGADVRLNVASIAVLETGFSLYLPLAAGDLAEGSYYGQASLFGMAFRFLFGYKLTEQFEIVAMFDYSRYQFSFDDKGARQADSAADQIMQFGIGARFNH